jgi:hypothetical protein
MNSFLSPRWLRLYWPVAAATHAVKSVIGTSAPNESRKNVRKRASCRATVAKALLFMLSQFVLDNDRATPKEACSKTAKNPKKKIDPFFFFRTFCYPTKKRARFTASPFFSLRTILMMPHQGRK